MAGSASKGAGGIPSRLRERFTDFHPTYESVSRKLKMFFPLLCAFIFFFSFYYGGTNDLWFLLEHGRYIVENGAFPTTEWMTMHEGFDFVMQQWLFATFSFLIIDNFGMIGALLTISLFFVGFSSAIYAMTMKFSNKNRIAAWIITLLMSFLMLAFHDLRPFLFSSATLMAAVFFLEMFSEKKNWKWLIPLVPLSVFLINSHASIWPMILVLFLPYFASRIPLPWTRFFKESFPVVPLIIAFVATGLAGFVNPYGWDAMTYLMGSYGYSMIDNFVQEMSPLSYSHGTMFFGLMIAMIILFSFIIGRRKNMPIKVRHLLMFIGLAFMAFQHARGMFVLIVCCIPAFAYLFYREGADPAQKITYEKNDRFGVALLTVVMVCLTCYTALYSQEAFTRDPSNKEVIEAILNDADYSEDDTVYTGYDDGSYAGYRGLKVYIDVRAEVFLKANNHKEDIFSEYTDMSNGTIYWQDFLDKYEFDYLILREDDILYYAIKNSDEYEMIHERGTGDEDKTKYAAWKRIEQ